MPANKVTLLRSDGLHILTNASLFQLSNDETLQGFADGLAIKALSLIPQLDTAAPTLAESLHHPGPQFRPLLTALLVLDAEVSAVIDDEPRVFPLPGFLSYRARLPLDKFPLNTMRLPPLNPDGHYWLKTGLNGFCCAVRLDLHPRQKVAGHVRLAVSSSSRQPVRLPATEHRLDRQILEADLIEEAILAGSRELAEPLTDSERVTLFDALHEIMQD